MRFFKYHFLFFFWLVVIFTESSFPSDFYPKVEIFNADKILHMGIYGLLSCFCYISLIHQQRFPYLKTYAVYYSVLISGIYGVTDELHQLFVPNRSCDIWDWTADFAGAIIMGLVINFYLRKKYVLFKATS